MSLAKHISKVVEASGKKSILGLFFSKDMALSLGDGNIGFNKLIKGPTAGKLMGTDMFGNQYYENPELPYGRKRWVVYGSTENIHEHGPTAVPAEWHGWLNHVNDYTPTTYDFQKPKYAIDHFPTKSGTGMAYQPKGAWVHGKAQRSWKKMEFWASP